MKRRVGSTLKKVYSRKQATVFVFSLNLAVPDSRHSAVPVITDPPAALMGATCELDQNTIPHRLPT